MRGAAMPSFSTLREVVDGVASTSGTPVARLGAAAGVLTSAVSASTGLLAHGSADRLDVRRVDPPWSATSAPPMQIHGVVGDLPLVDRVLAGSTEVASAARAYGEGAWAASPSRALCRELWGVDQLLCLPVRSGPGCLVFFFGRLGEDFQPAALGLLARIRPVVGLLADVLDAEQLPEPGARLIRLTRRESDILTLLAEGHTAVRIAHLAGCSPRTVHHHLGHIYAKLDVGDRLSAVTRASALGLIDRRGARPAGSSGRGATAAG